jgi:hypothetical protein
MTTVWFDELPQQASQGGRSTEGDRVKYGIHYVEPT